MNNGQLSKIKPWHTSTIMVSGGCTPSCACGECEFFLLTPDADELRIWVDFHGFLQHPEDVNPATPICYKIDESDIVFDENGLMIVMQGPEMPRQEARLGSFKVEDGFAGFVRETVLGRLKEVQGDLSDFHSDPALDEEQFEFLSMVIYDSGSSEFPSRSCVHTFLAHFSDDDRRRLFWDGPGSYKSMEFNDFVEAVKDPMNLEDLERDWPTGEKPMINVPKHIEVVTHDIMIQLINDSQ